MKLIDVYTRVILAVIAGALLVLVTRSFQDPQLSKTGLSTLSSMDWIRPLCEMAVLPSRSKG
jgi:hypothetical protein